MKVDSGRSGFVGERDDQLGVVSVGDDVESVASDDGCKGGHVDVEEDRAQGGALGYSAADLCRLRVEQG